MAKNEVYCKDNHEFKIVAVATHKNTGVPIYTIEMRKFGEDDVSYFLQEGDFDSSYKYEGQD